MTWWVCRIVKKLLVSKPAQSEVVVNVLSETAHCSGERASAGELNGRAHLVRRLQSVQNAAARLVVRPRRCPRRIV